MKKYLNTILFLSFTGIVVTAILLYQHYHPDLDLLFISCGKGFHNPCIAVGQSKYSVIFGVPLAALGMIFYIFITFMLLLADYTKEKYYPAIYGIILPVVGLSVAGDLVLALLLIKLGSLCQLCVFTYVLNIAILVLLLLMIKNNSSFGEIISSIKSLFVPENSDQRAVLALLILFAFFLTFSIIAGSNVMRMNAGQNAPSEKTISKAVSEFYATPSADISFPESSMVIGSKNPKVKIHVFIDFLCSACLKFYNVEKYILTKYGESVQIVYYHYPLDRTCNRDVEDTMYAESCTASKSMYSAAAAGFFEEYFFTHFSNHSLVEENYDEKTIGTLLEKTTDKFGIDQAKLKKFRETFESASYPQNIYENIEFAIKMKVSGTPTIYIGGREYTGPRAKEILETIILSELSRSGR